MQSAIIAEPGRPNRPPARRCARHHSTFCPGCVAQAGYLWRGQPNRGLPGTQKCETLSLRRRFDSVTRGRPRRLGHDAGPSRARTAASPASLPFPQSAGTNTTVRRALVRVRPQRETVCRCVFPTSTSTPRCCAGSPTSASPSPRRSSGRRCPRPSPAATCWPRHDRQRQDRGLRAADPAAPRGPPRGATRALVLTPTRELAAQVHEHLRALGRHTRVTVGGGLRRRQARPAGARAARRRRRGRRHPRPPPRPPGHRRWPASTASRSWSSTRPTACSTWASSRRPPHPRAAAEAAPDDALLGHACREPIVAALPRHAGQPGAHRRRAQGGAGHRRHARGAAGAGEAQARCCCSRCSAATRSAWRWSSPAPSTAPTGSPSTSTTPGISCDRIHGNRSQAQREAALAAFKGGRLRVLVATDIASRGIDVQDLPHVINFDVPAQPDDYIHRVGRTARVRAHRQRRDAGLARGGAGDLAPSSAPWAAASRAAGSTGSTTAPSRAGRLEIPIAERIAAIRAQRSEERARSRATPSAEPARAPQGRRRRSARTGNPPADNRRRAASRPRSFGRKAGR